MLRLIDLMPTLLDQLRLPRPKGMQGVDFSACVTGTAPATPLVAFAESVKLGDEQKAVYVGDLKLIVTVPTQRRELYNMARDPLEQNDLAADPEQELDLLSRVLDEQVRLNARLAQGFEPQTAELTDAQYELLKSLGYVE
jgi:arylsulfatase A-like enzyme